MVLGGLGWTEEIMSLQFRSRSRDTLLGSIVLSLSCNL